MKPMPNVRGSALTARLNAMLTERGIQLLENSVVNPMPTVTVYPSMAVVTRLAHAAADAMIAVDPAYAATCARLDAELAGILSGGSARAPSLPDILTTD